MNLGYILGINLDIPLWLLLLVATLALYYIYMTWPFDTFKKMGLSGPRPILGLGNIHQMMRKGFLTFELENKRKYGKLFGVYMGRTPTLMIHDLDMLRQILIKEFPTFQNRLVNDFFDPNDPFSRMLTMTRDDHWKHVRNTLSPTFSAGKLKMMNKQINWCADQLLGHIDEYFSKDAEFELKELMGEYTMDVIASTGFGLQLDSHKNPDNIFIVNSKRIMKLTLGHPKFIALFLFPFLRRILQKTIPLFPKDIASFFSKIPMDVIKARKEGKPKSNVDFIQLMADQLVDDTDDNNVVSKNGTMWNQNGLTSKDVIGNSAIFIIAGYDTTSNTLCFVFYNLAVHQECQDTLIQEIDEQIQGKEPHYEDLPKLTYLQQVIDETLRLYPPAPRVDRSVERDVTINGVFIPKGLMVGVPIYALQMDPDVWPEPERFDPDRFTAEKKASRDPLSYMPFGYGPRNCIGMRLALMEMKIAIIKILQKYRVVKCEKTQIPLEIDKARITPKHGAWIKVGKRSI